MSKLPGLQHAADLAEKYGDTKTQDNVKKMQYPYATGFWGKDSGTDPSLYPSEARMQRYRTNDKAAQNADKKPMPKMHKGGIVKKTGPYVLKKGERVLTAPQQKHPGFKKVAASIARKEGVPPKRAGAILASATRKASKKAKASNPRLKRVKMPKK